MSWYYFGETAVTGHHVKMMLRENDVNIFLFNLDWHFRSILNEAITLNFNMAMATIARLNAMIFQLQKKKNNNNNDSAVLFETRNHFPPIFIGATNSESDKWIYRHCQYELILQTKYQFCAWQGVPFIIGFHFSFYLHPHRKTATYFKSNDK